MIPPHSAAFPIAPRRDNPAAGAPARPARRRLPPAYSPLTAGAVIHVAAAIATGQDPRPEFCDALTRDFHAARVVLLDSGTHALELAIRLAMRAAGGSPVVALPAYTCYDVATAAVATGFPVLLYDVVPHTLEPDLDSLAAALRLGARVVVVAPLFGGGARWDEIDAMATRADAAVVEDAAQGHGSNWQGVAAGCHAATSVLSFGRGKGWTGAGGGAVLMRGRAAAAFDARTDVPTTTASSAAVLARALAMCALTSPSRFALASALPWLHLGETRYRRPDRMRSMARASAALLAATRAAAITEAAGRQSAGREYRSGLVATPVVYPLMPVPHTHGGDLRFPVRVAGGFAGFAHPARARSLGIAPAYPASLGELPAIRQRLASTSDRHMPGAEMLARQLITLPTHSLASPQERRAIIDLLERYPWAPRVR